MVGFGFWVLGWVKEHKDINYCWWTSARSNYKQIFSGLGIWWGFDLGLGFGVGVGVWSIDSACLEIGAGFRSVWSMGCSCLIIGTGFRSVARVTVHSNCA